MIRQASPTPATISDPVNAAILAVSEDRLAGFQADPFGEIAQRSGVPAQTVIERVVAMLQAGTIRRVRQTLLSTSLASGALCAWEIPTSKLDEAFDFMFREDPFSGHVVIRTTDVVGAGSSYRLWTTLKVPQGFSLRKHADWLRDRVGAQRFRLMPAKMLFTLGVGHVRRRGLAPGSRTATPGEPLRTSIVTLSALEWRVLVALKREFAPSEIARDLWRARAGEAGVDFDTFVAVAQGLNAKGVIGRFSTFLEHVKPVAGNEPATRYNALFHWAVAPGREIDAGREVARHYVVTHAYWREGGPEFHDVNVMAVAHGMEKTMVLAHKAAIDAHLREAGIDFTYTNVFWGGRSEIKPSEIAPAAYRDFCAAQGIDPDTMQSEEDEEGASA
ncbi:MAG: Lrp/AsnC family transcriptional regulator [Candidatus Eremiobacteraeota bacterium]|nr:Lrp/AsnC family transcriptional regulator [Candidatus Eremiobacteraeota bacterium]